MESDQDPRWLRLRPSRIHLVLTVGGALTACGIITVLPVPLWQRVALIAVMTVVAIREIRRARLRGSGAVTAFYLTDAGTAADAIAPVDDAPNGNSLLIRLRYAQALSGKPIADLEGIVQPGAFVTPWFASVPYRLAADPGWRKRWPRIVSLWPDSLDADSFRRVRVLLKWT